MAFDEQITFNRRTVITAADMSAKQFYCMTRNGSGGTVNVGTAAKATDGVLQDNPVSGKAGAIAVSGITKAAISASQTLTAGVTLLEVDTGGTLKATSGGIVVAKALEALDGSIAAVTYIAVELLPSNAVFA